MTVREPEFSAQDLAWLIRDFNDEHQPRSSTGIPWSVATDPKNRGRFTVDAETDFALESKNAVVREYEAKYGKDSAEDLRSTVFMVVAPPDITE